MQTELISVIIPAYNAGKYIDQSIQSVLSQDLINFEIIVVDDGSTDNTIDVLEKYKKRIVLFQQTNSGVAKARNFAAKNAHGKWLAFLDADDIWKSNKLSTQIGSIGEYAWSHANSTYFGYNQDGDCKRSDLTPQYGGDVFEKLIVNNFITTSTVVIRKDVYLSCKGFDESFGALEDWKLWIDVARSHPVKYNSEVLGEYRILPGSTSRKARLSLPLHLRLVEEVFYDLTMNAKYKRLKLKALYESYNVCSYIAEDSKDYSYSLYCALVAWRYNLGDITAFKRTIRVLLNYLKLL